MVEVSGAAGSEPGGGKGEEEVAMEEELTGGRRRATWAKGQENVAQRAAQLGLRASRWNIVVCNNLRLSIGK